MTCPPVGAVIGLSCAKTDDAAMRKEKAAMPNDLKNIFTRGYEGTTACLEKLN